MLRRQLSHLTDIWYGMPEAESWVMITACHFMAWPPL